MSNFTRRALIRLSGATFVGASAFSMQPAAAQEVGVRFARQFGIHYLPLIVMESQGLVEKHGKANGIPNLKVQWATLSGGASVNDALLSGAVDFAASGVGPLIVLWDKSMDGKGDVKAVAAVSDVPMTLTTRNPAVKGIEDFTANDKIALPAVKTSQQAVTLQMAAAKKWGIAEYARLDRLTVSMRHPDAAAAMMAAGQTEVTADFTAPPYDFWELRVPGIHRVLDSYDVYGGPATLITLNATTKYVETNPKLVKTVFDALAEAMAFIDKDRRRSAEIYVKVTKDKIAVDDVVAIISDPKIAFRLRPSGTYPLYQFMHGIGRATAKADSWKDLFFPIAHDLNGS